MSTLTGKTGCVYCASQHSMLKMTIPLFFIALCTIILEPDMQVCFRKLLCQFLLLGVDHMHVVVSLGAVFPIGAVHRLNEFA